MNRSAHDAAALARLHARCFSRPPPWSASAFDALCAEPGVFVIEREGGFVLGRTVLDEAELLTLAVAPETRRRGLGAALLAAFETEATRRGAAQGFLEVAEDNHPARALYARAGWQVAGRRPGYYGAGLGALLMRTALPQASLP